MCIAYTGGVNRAGVGHATDPNGYEFPGAIGVNDWGVGRLRNQYFSSEDQLVTLCLANRPHTSDERADWYPAILHGMGARQVIRHLDRLPQPCHA